MRTLFATFITAAVLMTGCADDEEEELEDTSAEECDTSETTSPQETTEPVEPLDTGDTDEPLDTGDTSTGEA